jgi:cupin 2 domain-containing protein
MLTAAGNIFEHVLRDAADEEFTELVAAEGVRIERIVSTGQASPPGFWYDQEWSEWVLVLSGSAGLLFEGEPTPRELKRGDYLLIPAGRRHRVEWTDATEPTIWLAVHYGLLPRSESFKT